MFYRVKNNALLDFANTKYSDECLYTDIVTQEQLAKDVSQVMVVDNELVLNPNYEAEQEQKERERIAKLFLTGADVERGIYQAKGMDFDDILAFVMANPPQGLDVKALRIELKANHFYRGNPYVNAVGTLLGFTSEQLDKFFATNDYTCLLPATEEEEVIDDTNNSTAGGTDIPVQPQIEDGLQEGETTDG